MLFLVFQVGNHRYAIDAGQIAEVLPLAAVTEIAQAPEEVAGVLVYRGVPVPVVDLSQLLAGRQAERRMSTRLVIVRYPMANDETKLLGLIAEKATETIRRDALEFVDSGVVNDRAPHLGSVAPDPRGMLQRVDIPRLLTARHQMLFGQLQETAWPSPTSRTS